MVGTPSDVESVTLGPDGVLAGLKPGGLLVEMTTSTPSLAGLADKLEQRWVPRDRRAGVCGDVGAKAGTLSIMCGVPRWPAPCRTELMGKTIKHMGGLVQATPRCNRSSRQQHARYDRIAASRAAPVSTSRRWSTRWGSGGLMGDE